MAMTLRETADTRKQALIEATAACLAESGVSGCSVRAICNRAGVTAGLLVHYFPGVNVLIAETYRHVANKVAVALQNAADGAGDDPKEQLIAFVTASFRPPIADPALLSTWLAFWGLVKTNPTIAEIHRKTYRDYRADVEALLIACGLAEAEARLAAIAFTALVDGLWLELSLDPASFTPAEAGAIVTAWLDVLLKERRFIW